MKKISKYMTPLLLITAFSGGAMIMILEILGGRVLAPYFGNTVYQWGAVIGIVMTAMSVGYHIGGKIGDQKDAIRKLTLFLLITAFFIFFHRFFVPYIMMSAQDFGLSWGVMIGSFFLLGVPGLLLATVSPIIIGQLSQEGEAGKTSGRVYAISTLGSIFGTFLVTFYMIPELGVKIGYQICGFIALFITLLLFFFTKKVTLNLKTVFFTIFYVLCFSSIYLGALSATTYKTNLNVIYEDESLYNAIKVVQQGQRKYLFMNNSFGSHSLWDEKRTLKGQERDYFSYATVAPLMMETPPQKALFLGVGGGIVLKMYHHFYPDLKMTGVEIDPAVLKVAREVFDLKEEKGKLDLFVDDARHFVTQATEKYDIIIVDLYKDVSIPAHCATKEFAALLKSRLTEKGIVIVNVLGAARDTAFFKALQKTFQSAFADILQVDAEGNVFMVSFQDKVNLKTLKNRIKNAPKSSDLKDLSRLFEQGIIRLKTVGEEASVFTDDQSHAEKLSFDVFKKLYQHNLPQRALTSQVRFE
ncbi:MAG: spermidine synthase [Alphaproteobacteria bacterium]